MRASSTIFQTLRAPMKRLQCLLVRRLSEGIFHDSIKGPYRMHHYLYVTQLMQRKTGYFGRVTTFSPFTKSLRHRKSLSPSVSVHRPVVLPFAAWPTWSDNKNSQSFSLSFAARNLVAELVPKCGFATTFQSHQSAVMRISAFLAIARFTPQSLSPYHHHHLHHSLLRVE